MNEDELIVLSKKFIAISFCFVSLLLVGCYSKKKVVYIYGYAGYFPSELLKKFEEETGIEAIYDAYESDDILETDLCMESSYDVVIITAWPSFAKAAKAKLFHVLSLEKIPNFKYIDSIFLSRVAGIDVEPRCGVPYLFGSVGLGVNTSVVSKNFLNTFTSWNIIFDADMIQKVASHRVYLLDSGKDVFQAALLYLGKNPCSNDTAVWKEAYSCLKKVHPFVTRFQNSHQEETLLERDAGIIQGFSDNIALAAAQGKAQNPPVNIRYVIPKEGVMLTIDMMAIPKGAAHVEAAHQFINFVLRPENMAALSNSLKSGNTSSASYPWVSKNLLNNPAIFPKKEDLKLFYADFLPSITLMRYISDLWLNLVSNQDTQKEKDV